MLSRAIALIVGLILFSTPQPAAAEDQPDPEGPRVRVTSPVAPSGRIEGTLVGLDEEALTVRESKESSDVRLRRESITGVEISRRRSNRGKAVAIGALVGGGVALGIGLATGKDCQPGDFLCFDKGATSVLSGLLTVPAGALLGLAFSHGEKWETTTVDRLSVAIGPVRGGAAISLSFRF